jgi:hypothetical protein
LEFAQMEKSDDRIDISTSEDDACNGCMPWRLRRIKKRR